MVPGPPFWSASSIAPPNRHFDCSQQLCVFEDSIEWCGQIGRVPSTPHTIRVEGKHCLREGVTEDHCPRTYPHLMMSTHSCQPKQFRPRSRGYYTQCISRSVTMTGERTDMPVIPVSTDTAPFGYYDIGRLASIEYMFLPSISSVKCCLAAHRPVTTQAGSHCMAPWHV